MGFNLNSSKSLGYLFLWTAIIARATGEVQLKLNLNNSSPAVLYSNVTFVAELKITAIGFDPLINFYRYVWIDGASNTSVETYSNDSSEISQVYTPATMTKFKAGEYEMKVEVFEKVNQSIVKWKGNEKLRTTASMSFQLTEHLNTKVTLNQSLGAITPEGVFATRRNLSITVKVYDIFDNVSYVYELYTNNSKTPNISTNVPRFAISYENPGYINIRIKTIAFIVDYVGQHIYIEKKHQWVDNIVLLKEQVHHIEYLGSSEYDKGQNISARFVCYGSPPFFFSWGVAANIQPQTLNINNLHYKQSQLKLSPNQSGSVLKFQDGFGMKWKSDHTERNNCFAEYRNVFNETGNFTLYLRIENDVGYNQTHVVLHVVQPDHIEPVVITASVLIAVLALITILIVYIKERQTFVQTPNEETANHYFYFNPKDGNALQEYKSVDSSGGSSGININNNSYNQPTSPRRVKDGLSVMYNTAKNWVTGIASSYTSQNSTFSYEEL